MTKQITRVWLSRACSSSGTIFCRKKQSANSSLGLHVWEQTLASLDDSAVQPAFSYRVYISIASTGLSMKKVQFLPLKSSDWNSYPFLIWYYSSDRASATQYQKSIINRCSWKIFLSRCSWTVTNIMHNLFGPWLFDMTDVHGQLSILASDCNELIYSH